MESSARACRACETPRYQTSLHWEQHRAPGAQALSPPTPVPPVTLGHPTRSIHIPLHQRITYALPHAADRMATATPCQSIPPHYSVTLAGAEAQGM